VADFGPRITVRIVDRLREDILAGKLKSGAEIKVSSIETISCFSRHAVIKLDLDCLIVSFKFRLYLVVYLILLCKLEFCFLAYLY